MGVTQSIREVILTCLRDRFSETVQICSWAKAIRFGIETTVRRN